ncbi:FKBP-type peptidyl-prolyl cis-trans isomerase [Spongiimicrobium sp. 3-5]|uniref:FKBP-type peptidyl-prolyl cis-trans isomerase n=1 Tax=Spongiimicrobium sp. 3-5 TaxID=3332596 RepID=UPI0039807383
MKKNKVVFFLTMIVIFGSCKKDDDPGIEVVPPRTLAEVEAEDAAEIIAFLDTHFYNYEEFASPPADFDFRIKIDTIAGDNAGKIPLRQQVEDLEISVSSSEFGLSEEETVTHTMYYLEAREGIGEGLTVADSSFVRYQGSLLNGNVFDGSLNVPIWFDLATLQGPLQGARGFAEGTHMFKAGGPPTVNPDGTFSVEDYGIGMMIFPSGLGFFNSSGSGSIPAYSPMIFTVDLYTVNDTDHDGDGIPSILEDLDGDGYLYNDNTDIDGEDFQRFPNFGDPDDDGDGTRTREEIIINDDGTLTFPDTDGDGTPDYLDPDNF